MKRLSGKTISTRRPNVYISICAGIFCFLSVGLRVYGQSAEFTQNKGGNRAVTLEVPLANYPGRGASVPVNLNYSSAGLWRIGFINTVPMGSSVWRAVTEGIYAEHSTAGWTTSLDVPKVEWPKQNDIFWYTGKAYPRGTVPPFTFRVANLFMHMPDGSTHEMRKTDTVYADGGFVDMVGTFYSVDGSRLRYDSTGQHTGTLFLPDGGRYILSSSTVQYIDRNGNTMNYNVNARQWTDTMGRTLNMPWPANPGPGDYTYSVPGVNGSSKIYTIRFASLSGALTPDAQGQFPAMKAAGDYYLPDPNSMPTGPSGGNHPQPVSGATLFTSGYSDPEETSQSYVYVVGRGQSGSNAFNPTVLSEIILPTGQSYKFTYNIHGELTKVIYPTGAYQRYSHGTVFPLTFMTFPYPQGNRGMSTRTLSPSGTGSDEAQWTYSPTNNPMTVTAPDGTRNDFYLFVAPNQSENFGYRDSRMGMVTEERVFAPVAQGGAMLRRTLYQYGQTTSITNKPVPPNTFNTGTYTGYRNPRLEKQVTIILDTGGNALARTVTHQYIDNTFQFSTGLDRNSSIETHFASVDPTTAQSGAIASIPAGTTASRVETVYLNNASYRNRNILGLPTSVILQGIVNGSLQTVSRSDSFYDEVAFPLLTYGDLTGPDYIDPGTSIRGNVTTRRRYIDAAGATSYLDTNAQFDQCGNVRKSWNERDQITETEYSSDYEHAYATQITTPVPDPSGAHGSNAAFVTSTTYDFNTGLTATTTDANGRVTTFSYKDDQNNNDPLNRLRKVTRADGSWTKHSFGDAVGNIFALTETQLDANRTTQAYEYKDPMGRPSRSFVSEGGNSYIATDTLYDIMGRTWKISNPYRTTTLDGVADLAHTSHWTTSTYDPLGRVLSITHPDSSAVTTSYEGVYTTVTDEAGKQRRQKTDVFGRVIRVDESNSSGSLGDFDSPAQATSYEYDVQGNIVHITQGSSPVQHRYFKYDGLARPTHERQPEQIAIFNAADPLTGNSNWTRRLVYDETIDLVTYSGLLTSTYDPRNVETRFRYDFLNRVYQTNYSDGTPTLTSKYDQNRGVNYSNKGRLTEALTAAAGSIPATGLLYNYDAMGRVVNHEQTVGSQAYVMNYNYNLSGALTSQTYPSGRVVTYGFDDASRLSQVSSGATTYANQYDYTSPTGFLKSVTFGNNAIQTHVYNSRLQLQSIDLTRSGSQLQRYELKYGVYDPVANTLDESKNNRQIAQIEGFIGAQKQWQQRYAYDKLGRLASTREIRGDNSQQSYLVNYDYDVFGNRYLKQAQNGANPFTPVWVETSHVDQATNRYSTGVTYDDAGNVTVDSKFRNRKFEYDANNRQKQSKNLDNSGAVDSVFDATGQRVGTQAGGALTSVIVYDVNGKLLAEYNATTAQGGTQYIFNDQQGSPRVISGTQGTIIARHDYLPFGDDVLNTVGMRTSGQGYGGTEAARQKYAAMETDPATGMSHTLWRKYDSTSGRWTAPDPYAGSMTLAEPQSFNRYTYVNNDPVNKVDPLGLALSDIGVYQTTNPLLPGIVDRILNRMVLAQVAQRSGAAHRRSVTGGWLTRAINKAIEERGLKFVTSTTNESSGSETEEKKEESEGEVTVSAEVTGVVQTPQNPWRSLSFSKLWTSHPTSNGSTATADRCPCLDASGGCQYTNQCAIRLSKSLQGAGIDMSKFPGNNKCGNNYAIRAKELADWISGGSRLGAGEKFTDHTQLMNRINGQKGIVHIRQFTGTSGSAYDHIDLWDGNKMAQGLNTWFNQSPSYVRFWPINNP